MDRRKFIQLTSVTGAGLAIGCKKDPVLSSSSERIETPVLIIGSGFGGSVTALRLSQKGIKNTLIERGRAWEGHDFCSFTQIDKRSTWLNPVALVPIVNISVPVEKYTGVIEYHRYQNMNIFNAAGLGGGSLVFGATYVRPERSIFERLFPSEVSFEEMEEKYFSRVQEEIGFSGIPDDIYESEYYQYARSFREQIEKAGMTSGKLVASYDWDIIRKEMRKEIPLDFLKGDGNYGTRNGSKNSLDKTYIRKAVASGFTDVHTLTNVVNISIRSDKKYEVETERINETGKVLKKSVFICDKLFLCAGAPNTIKLLLKARATSNLKELNNQIGQGFGTNGKTFFRRTIKENSGGYTGWTPAEAVRHFDNPHTPVLIENIPQPIALILPLPELHSHLHVGLGLAQYRGKYDYDPASDRLILDWDKSGLDDSIAAAKHWAEIVNSANPGSETDNVIIKDRYLNNLTYHPLGGCVIGQATDMVGRLTEYPNLYVNDSTLIPGVAACSNPAYVIAAIAERNIDKIIREDFS